MTCENAKKIDITSFLKKMGLEPQKTTSTVFWFCSPFHEDKTPSFKVDILQNLWYDFGSGIGGSLIDLIIKLNSNCTPSEALKILDSQHFDFSFHRNDNSKKSMPEPAIKNYSIKYLSNPALLQYCEARCIHSELAKQYLNEIYWKNADKQNFALAFGNDSGGFELRNKYWKGCIATKTISTIPGRNAEYLTVFEGFFDFLSYLAYYKFPVNPSKAIVLNSTANRDKISLLGYKKVFCFLDNDQSGKETVKDFQKRRTLVFDKSNIYKGYKDFNEFLIKSKI